MNATNKPTAPEGGESKSCQDCMFFMKEPHHQVESIGRAIKGTFCAKTHDVLTTNNLSIKQKKENWEMFPQVCGNYSKELVPSKVPMTHPPHQRFLQIYSISDIQNKAGLAETGDLPNTDKPDSCLGCVFHLDEAETEEATGIRSSSCSRRGILIGLGSARDIASDCAVGINTHSPKDAVKELNNNLINAKVPSIVSHLAIKDMTPVGTMADIDPSAVDTDAPVSDEDVANGIRAWRLIVDPMDDNGDASVLLPVFDPEFFSEEDRSQIPQTGSEEHPELYIDHMGLVYQLGVLWLCLNETPSCVGVSGVGKTELYRHIAWIMQAPFVRVSITNSTEIDDLAGRLEFDPKIGTWFHYGRIPQAWRRACVIVIDEPNVGPSDVWQFLRPLTDNSKQLVLDMNKGERIDRHPYCFMGMAMNPPWDERNVGTHEISDADGRRLHHIAVPPPPESVERTIISDRCKVDGYKIDSTTLNTIMKISKDLRNMAANNTIPIQWGTGQNIKVARASHYFDLKRCYRMAYADLLDPVSSEAIMNTVGSYIR